MSILEKYKGNEFAFFDDPYEALVFMILIGLMKEQNTEGGHRLIRET